MLTIFLLAGWSVFAQSIPPKPSPPRLVNDLTNTLSVQEISSLEAKLLQYEDSTSTQIAIVIVPTIGESDMNTYAVELGRVWGIGQAGKNNGILLLWSTGERKVYIATGYGAEGALPDAYAKRIVENHIIPNFKQGQYAQGLSDGVDQIIRYLAGEFEAEESLEEDNSWIFIFIFIIVVFIIISRFGRGSGGGGLRGGMPYTTYTGWGPSSGSWGSGSSDSGSFGGFGGGSFGGGGAGGSY